MSSASSSVRGASAVLADTTPTEHPSGQSAFAGIPPELVFRIFSNLDQASSAASTLVSRDFLPHAIVSVSRNQLLGIKRFIEAVIQRVNPEVFPKQIERLQLIVASITSGECTTCTTFATAKQYILVKQANLNAELHAVMQTLDVETLNDLNRHIDPPKSMEAIFSLVPYSLTQGKMDAKHKIKIFHVVNSEEPDWTITINDQNKMDKVQRPDA